MREALSVAMIASAAPESSLEHLQVKLADDTCIIGNDRRHHGASSHIHVHIHIHIIHTCIHTT